MQGRRPKQEVAEAKAKFLKIYAETPIITYACQQVGIAKETYYLWCRKDKNFKQKIEEINKRRIDLIEDAMIKTALQGNPTLLIFLACNWEPNRYKNIQKVDVGGTGQVIITFKKATNKNERD